MSDAASLRQTTVAEMPDGSQVDDHAEAPPDQISRGLQEEIAEARSALLSLAVTEPGLASTFARIVAAVSVEAKRSRRLARALSKAIETPARDGQQLGAEVERRTGRRSRGPFDPFSVFADIGEEGLRQRLSDLSVEQLRDIISEQRMDHDRLAMKWKDASRLSERIVERVKTRSVKGDVFRSA